MYVSCLEVMDVDYLQKYKKIYGAILLFPYTEKHKENSLKLFQLDPSSVEGLTFIPQVNYSI